MPSDTLSTIGFTVRDVARRYRVGEDTVRKWIKRGELLALNTADRNAYRPRFVVTPESLAAFERGRSVTPPPKQPRRKKQSEEVDYFPEL
jgi:transposase